MSRRALAVLGLVLLGSTPAPAATPAPTTPPKRDAAPAVTPVPAALHAGVGDASERGRFLPDSAPLARVNDRVIRADRFVDAYYASFAQYRPKPDSLGRVEFLNSMVNKEVMALTALAVNRPFTFEDRATMRAHTEIVLGNALYRRAIHDSVTVTAEDVRAAYAQYSWQHRYRILQLPDPNAADAVRKLLVAKRLTWSEAVRRYSLNQAAGDPGPGQGWINRGSIDVHSAAIFWDLAPGATSPVVPDADGYNLMQLIERRKVEPVAFEPVERIIRAQLQSHKASLRADRLQTQIGARIGMAYDTTNIRWAATQFRGHETMQEDSIGMVLNLSGSVPEIQPADTSRVLARHRDGRFTVGEFLHRYHDQSPVMRQPVSTFEQFRVQLDAMVLEPHMAEEARARGLDKDPLVVAELERKREQILVEHMFQDSIESKIWIPPDQRRKYYQDHVAQYMTYASVRFASIVRDSKPAADSLAARLRAGERAADILRADSLQGVISGSIRERREDQRGDYHKVLFEELRPGQASVFGPDKENSWLVIQLIEFSPGRQLPYEQVEHYVDESLQNIRAEEALKAMIERLKKRYRIEVHPELVMRIWLVDPASG